MVHVADVVEYFQHMAELVAGENNSRWSASSTETPRIVVNSGNSLEGGVHSAMESIHDQPDKGMRTTDFFDDSADEASAGMTDLPDKPDAASTPKSPQNYLDGQPVEDSVMHCGDEVDSSASPDTKSATPIVQGMDGFIRLTESPGPKHAHWPNAKPPERPRRPVSEASASYDFGNHLAESTVVGLARSLSMQRPLSGHVVHRSSPPKPSIIVEDADMIAAEAVKDEAIKDIHAQTLQALLRDDSAIAQAATRIAFGPDTEHKKGGLSATRKRVSLAPLPIDTHSGSLPENIVRTPYPLHFRKVYTRPSPIETTLKTEHDSILPLTIRRCGDHSHRPQRITHVKLPAEVGAQVDMTHASPATKEKHFESLDFDDAYLFTQIRIAYQKLSGSYQFLSARSLQSIRLAHSGACHADAHGEHCSHSLPCSPRYLESKGLTDSFSEKELLKHFRKPALGKSRYAWVHWAKRLSSCPSYLQSPAPNPPADSPSARLANIRRSSTSKDTDDTGVLYAECWASLEFVEGWSWMRIMMAFATVNITAVTAALCWILLGADISQFTGGYRHAGERVAGGAMLGVFVLLIGWTSTAGWLVLSSLVG